MRSAAMGSERRVGVCEAKEVARADAACSFGRWFNVRCRICTLFKLVHPREHAEVVGSDWSINLSLKEDDEQKLE